VSSTDEDSPSTPEKHRPPAELFFDDLKRREEIKREAADNPCARWRAVQECMACAASHSTGPKMTPSACKVKERRRLDGMAGMFERKTAGG
jgi:hypothetical protein